MTALGIGALLIGLEAREQDHRAWIDHTIEVIDALDAIQRITLQGESAVRGYLITANDITLDPYRTAAAEVEHQLATLNALVSDNPKQVPAAATLTQLVRDKFSYLEESVASIRNGTANVQIGQAHVGRGTNLMIQIHDILDVMKTREIQLLATRQEDEATARKQTQAAIAILFLLALALVALAIRIGVVRAREQLTAAREADNLRLIAEDANKAKSEFLAMMSHELRTPMAGVLGIADLVLMGELEDESRRLLQQLRRSATSLLDILNDILDFSKIEAGKLEIDEHAFLLSDILADVRTLFAPIASKKGVVFEVTMAPDMADGLYGDANRLRQVIVNLVNNAVKFTKHGRVDLHVAQQPIDDDKTFLQVKVTDTGIGMSEDVRTKLFEPFVQAGGKTSRRFGGTGLGLVISRRLIAAMHGDIQVDSVAGQGSTFRFEIPLTLASDVQPSGARPDRRAATSHTLRPLHLLLAEDTDTVRLVVVTMLKKLGHTVVAVTDGAAAVDAAKAERFDAILMDMQMPVMDGTEAAKVIRTFSSMPIIALTADAIPEHKEKYLAAGIDDLVTKPINWDLLTAKLVRLVGGAPASDAAETESKNAETSALLNETTIFDLTQTIGIQPLFKIWLAFENNVGGYRHDLSEAIGMGDLKRAKKVAHALKGLSAQIGAEQLAGRAAVIETRVQTAEEAAEELEHLTEIADKTLLALSARRNALA